MIEAVDTAHLHEIAKAAGLIWDTPRTESHVCLTGDEEILVMLEVGSNRTWDKEAQRHVILASLDEAEAMAQKVLDQVKTVREALAKRSS